MRKPVLLVCNTRTGSTAFGNALAASNAGLLFTGEAFNPAAVQQDGAFANWIQMQNVSAIEYLTDKEKLVDRYIEWMKESIDCEVLLFDLKYHDIFSFMPSPALLDFPPYLFAGVKKKEGSIVHLIRKNKFHAALSEVVANQTGIFHILKGQVLPEVKPFQIAWVELRDQITMRNVQEEVVRRQISHSSVPYVEVYYEDIFSEKQSDIMKLLSQNLEISLSLDHVLHTKIGMNYAVTIMNYKELVDEYENLSITKIWK